MAWSMASESTVLDLSNHVLSVKVLATQAKFLQPSDYCTVINCAFILFTTNVFDYFHGIMAQFEFAKHNFSN